MDDVEVANQLVRRGELTAEQKALPPVTSMPARRLMVSTDPGPDPNIASAFRIALGSLRRPRRGGTVQDSPEPKNRPLEFQGHSRICRIVRLDRNAQFISEQFHEARGRIMRLTNDGQIGNFAESISRLGVPHDDGLDDVALAEVVRHKARVGSTGGVSPESSC